MSGSPALRLDAPGGAGAVVRRGDRVACAPCPEEGPGPAGRSGWRLLGVVGLLVVLAACSSTPTSGGGGRKGGGYYQDDGPGRGEPADLGAIPDASPRREPLAARANRPYVVFGRRYVPATTLEPYREQGVASWYGRKFHGRRTSIGEVYDMYGMTAAHPTLPLPSYVRVTHVGNGRSVIVRVNDRGPFLNNRLIDLSWTAAAKLGYIRDGHTRVVVEQITRFDGDDGLPLRPPENLARAPTGSPGPAGATLRAAAVERPPAEAPGAASELAVESLIAAAPGEGPDDEARLAAQREEEAGLAPGGADNGGVGRDSPPAAVPPGVYVQLAAFANRDSAEQGRRQIQAEAGWIGEFMAIRESEGLYKLQAGPFSQRADAQQAVERLRQTTALRPFMTEY